MIKLSNYILRHRRLSPCLIVFLIISMSQLMVPYPLYAESQGKNLLIINSSGVFTTDYYSIFYR